MLYMGFLNWQCRVLHVLRRNKYKLYLYNNTEDDEEDTLCFNNQEEEHSDEEITLDFTSIKLKLLCLQNDFLKVINKYRFDTHFKELKNLKLRDTLLQR